MESRKYIETAVTLAELKEHLRIYHDSFDSDLNGKIIAATLSAEHHVGWTIARSEFIYKTKIYQDIEEVSIPIHAPMDISSLVVNINAKASDDYVLDYGQLKIPVAKGDDIEVRYTAGPLSVPEDLKVAILMIASDMFERPADGISEKRTASVKLLTPYRQWHRI